MNTTVKREGDRVWLEGITGWAASEMVSSVHAAQTRMMQAIGEEITYETLVGVSGLAFRTQMSGGDFCPSSPHSFCGYPCHQRSSEALPWCLQIWQVKPEETGKVAQARLAVVKSIDRGIPVQYGSEEDGIIVGYQKGGDEWICYNYMHEGEQPFVETEWPWGIAMVTDRKKDLPDERVLAVGAMHQAVEMSEQTEADGYALGNAAWDHWITTLEGLDAADEERRTGNMLGNAWTYESLIQYRSAAATYLHSIAGLFSETTAAHISAAAEIYDRMARSALCDDSACSLSIAPYPWSLQEGESWTSAQRADQVRRMRAARDLDARAIAHLRSALDTIAD